MSNQLLNAVENACARLATVLFLEDDGTSDTHAVAREVLKHLRAAIESEKARPSSDAELSTLRAENERLREQLEKDKFEPEPQEETRSPRDWRIGLTVKPRLRSDELYYERGTVADVLPNGTGGIDDKDGVLCIRMDSGNIILRRAGDWITA